MQEAWLRLDRASDDGIENLGGWLTTVFSRICLDQLRARSTRGEEPVESGMPEPGDDDPNPEDRAILMESTVDAPTVVLDTLTPIERVAFVLRDVFDVSFEEVAAIVDRSPVATRQLASRARRRARTATAATGRASKPRGEIVAAFFAAAREGRLDALIQLLAPGVVLRSDTATLRIGGEPEALGARAVAETFSGRTHAPRLARIDGRFGRSSRATPSAWDWWDVLGEAMRRSVRETNPPPVGPHLGNQHRVRRDPRRFGATPRSHAARYASWPTEIHSSSSCAVVKPTHASRHHPVQRVVR